MNDIITLAGLVLALLSAWLYAGNINNRTLIPFTSGGLGLALAGLCGYADKLAGLPAAIIGLAVWGIGTLALCQTFPAGEVRIFQRIFGRDPDKDMDDADMWLVMSSGFKPFWAFFCEHLATVKTGRLIVEDEAEVLFTEGLGTIRFRVDAEPPLGRPDLMKRFVTSVPAGTALTNAEARATYMKGRITALAQQMLEGVARNVSAFGANAPQLQAKATGVNPAGRNLVEELTFTIERLLGLPSQRYDEDDNLVPAMDIQIIDVILGDALKENQANRAENDAIREKAQELLTAEGHVKPDLYRLKLRERQQRDAARYAAMSPADLANVDGESRIIKLRIAFDRMMTVPEFEAMSKSGKQGTGIALAKEINEYRKLHADAETALASAKAEEVRYRRESMTAEAANVSVGDAALAEDPKRVTLAERLEKELDEYRKLYGEILANNVDKTAAGLDTSRISIAGLEGASALTGVEALRAIRAGGKRGGGE